MEQATKDADGADEAQTTDKPQKMQMDWMRYKQQMQTERVTKDIDGADDSSTADANADADIDVNGAYSPGTDIEGATGSDSNGNSKTRCSKIISFSINDIIGYGYSM